MWHEQEKVVKINFKTDEKKRSASMEYWNSRSIEWRLWTAAKKRCKNSGFEFTIKVEDIPPCPEFCPITGLRIRPGENGKPEDYSPSLDRVDNTQGYVPGNVRIISHRANTCKRDLTIEEIRKLYEYIRD